MEWEGAIGLANNWSEIAPDLTQHDFEIYHNISQAFDMHQFHSHSFYEIRLIRQGYVSHYDENSSSDLGPGSISILPPGVFHRTSRTPSRSAVLNYDRILLYVSPQFLQQMDTDSFKISPLFDSFADTNSQSLLLTLTDLDKLYQPLSEIVQTNRDDEPLIHLQNRAKVMLVLAQLAERIMQHGASQPAAEDTSLVPQVIAYINANLSENLSLDSLANRFFVNKFYLSHQFKAYTQLSLHQYVVARRMQHAQALLRQGKSPLAVSEACGYREYSSFYKAFLKETGQSPKTFS